MIMRFFISSGEELPYQVELKESMNPAIKSLKKPKALTNYLKKEGVLSLEAIINKSYVENGYLRVISTKESTYDTIGHSEIEITELLTQEIINYTAIEGDTTRIKKAFLFPVILTLNQLMKEQERENAGITLKIHQKISSLERYVLIRNPINLKETLERMDVFTPISFYELKKKMGLSIKKSGNTPPTLS